jgi:hypothetical protein
MYVSLQRLRTANPLRFSNVERFAKQLAGVPARLKAAEPQKQDKRLVKVRAEWERASRHEDHEENERLWILAMAAILALFHRHPHHTPA